MRKALLKEQCNIKDRTMNVLMIIFLVGKTKCKLKHVQQWLISFADYYNRELIT
jgi:hypothetical protein